MPPNARRSSSYDLVSFTHPPVAEVALSAQFGADTVDLEALGLFAHLVRPEFPVRQQQPMVPPMIERFDQVPLAGSIEIHFDALGGPITLPRTWFLSEGGAELVQLQHDRLTLNWRELGHSDGYPRYEVLRVRFSELLATLMKCVNEAGKEATINLCEVTYVNPVEHPSSNLDSGHADLAEIINRLQVRPPDAFLPEAEDAQLQARWRIPSDELGSDGRPVGRLYLTASPGLRPPNNTPIYMINLTGRVISVTGDASGALAALDVAHKWVVLGFKDLTTPEMHRRWGIQENSQ